MIKIILKEAKRIPSERIYGYEHEKEKIGKKFLDSDFADPDKVQMIKNVYLGADEDIRDFFSRWYEHAGAAVEDMANKLGVNARIAKCVTAILSPGNTFLRNLKSAETLIRNYKFGEDKRVDTNNVNNVRKALMVLESGDENSVSWRRSPKTSLFFRSLVNPNEVKGRIVIDGHAISIWLGKKLPLKSPEVRGITKAKLEEINAAYIKAAEDLNIEPHALQAVTWAVWKNTQNAEALLAKKKA